MKTFIRPATLLDILGVMTAMAETPRGVEELEQARNLGGASIRELAATQLFLDSSAILAMATPEEPYRALAVAGYLPQRFGVLRTWMFATDEAWLDHGFELTQHVADSLNGALSMAHRIETICSDSRLKTHRWYARIGLEKEATLKRYMADGSDAALFVRLRRDN
jgi:hypothetical protein